MLLAPSDDSKAGTGDTEAVFIDTWCALCGGSLISCYQLSEFRSLVDKTAGWRDGSILFEGVLYDRLGRMSLHLYPILRDRKCRNEIRGASLRARWFF